MAGRIPIAFRDFGPGPTAVVDYSVHLWRPRRDVRGFALVDTGSNATIFPEELLRSNGWPVERAKREPDGIRGIGGTSTLRYLEHAVFGLVDEDGALQVVNLDRVYFTTALFPTILGADVMRGLNAKLYLDFADETGHMEIG